MPTSSCFQAFGLAVLQKDQTQQTKEVVYKTNIPHFLKILILFNQKGPTRMQALKHFKDLYDYYLVLAGLIRLGYTSAEE